MIQATVQAEDPIGNFRISFSDHNGYDVVVRRSLQNLAELGEMFSRTDFIARENALLFPEQDNPNCSQLQVYLNAWLQQYNENPQVTDILTDFMEDFPGQSALTQLQFNVLREKIARLTKQNRQYEQALNDMINKSAQLSEMVGVLQSKLNSCSSSNDDLPAVGCASNPESPVPLHGVVPTATLTPINSESSMSGDFVKNSMKLSELHLNIPSTEGFSVEASNAEDNESPRNNSSAGGSNKHAYSASEIKMTAEHLWRNFPEGSQVRRFEESVREIVSAIQPHPSQISYRASVIALVKRQVRCVLRVNAFECGLHVLRCFLPDDPTRLTVVLGRSRVAQWHKTLHDRLTVLSEQTELSRVDRTNDDDFATDQDDEFPVCDHVVSKVQVASEDANFKVDCLVDATEVSISCNRRGDICLLAFIEEFASLVGQEDLFKRSLLLIRAWWFYETTAYGNPIRHYISDGGMCIMVCAIFNQFHARITSPLQALCLFLAEYSAYDGATHAITLQGIVPFPEGAQLVMMEPQESHLVTAAIMDKYWVLFNIQEASTSAAHFSQSQQIIDELNDDLARGSFLTKGHKPHYQSVFHGASQRSNVHGASRFERSGFNVANPFVNSNMVERLVTRRLQKVQRAFAAGASQCLLAVTHSGGEENAAIRALFPVVFHRFGQGFVRPDRMNENTPQYRNNAISYVDNQLLVVQVERLLSHIMYCNFVLESVLSDSALLLLCTEILKEKKVQPVGEVGKMLAEITSSPNLSAKLKEKFGGLKKFLEYFSGRFIFSNDHPFNPSVTLRSILDSMNLEPTDKGVQNLTNIHKARKSGSKRTSPMPSPDPTYANMQGLSPPYFGQQPQMLTPGSTGSSVRSMSAYVPSPPGASPNALTGTPGRPETYSYGGGGAVDSRRKINAYGSVAGGEQLWLTTPRGTISSTPAIAEYSPRQSIQRAQQNLQQQARPYSSGQAQNDLHQQQFGSMPRNPRTQQQQQQQAPPPPPQYGVQNPQLGYSAGRQFATRPQIPPQVPMSVGADPRQVNGAYPVRNAPMPLYARQGVQPQQSPQNQSRELDALRYSLQPDQGVAQPQRQSGGGGGGPLYQRPSLAGNSLHSSGEDVNNHYGDLFRDINLSFSLNEFPHADSLLSSRDGNPALSVGMSGTPFSNTISRPSSTAPNAKLEEDQWY